MEDSRGPRRRAALRAAQWARMSHPPMLFAFSDNRYGNTRVPATAPNQMGIRAAILLPRPRCRRKSQPWACENEHHAWVSRLNKGHLRQLEIDHETDAPVDLEE
jgi:hypothetical protein